MGLYVGSTPVTGVYVGSTPVTGIYAGTSVGYDLIWSATVQITLGAGMEARDQFRAALAARGLDYTTITEVPFDIELVGTGSSEQLFYGCRKLTSVPPLDTSNVWNMNGMFQYCNALVTVPPLDTSNVWNAPSMFAFCYALTSVPDMDAAKMTNVTYMFTGCTALTDGNVRLIGRNPNVNTASMISSSGLTREPFYKADGTPDDGIEVHKVSLTGVKDRNKVHPLLTVTVPAGETWDVRIQGTVTKAEALSGHQPHFRIGATNSGGYKQGTVVDFSGTVTAANSTIAMVTNSSTATSFVGTVTIKK